MKRSFIIYLTKFCLPALFVLTFTTVQAQDDGSDFWSHVRFGGGLGASFGNGYTDVMVAPGAIYQFNEYVAAGAGLQGSYVRQKYFYDSWIYGGSLIGLFNPIPEIQLSAEVEQLRVNLTYDDNYNVPEPAYPGYTASRERNFWNTALFVGAGYNTGNVVVGVRYNVLFNERDYVYSDAFMPFIRVYF
ncbi:hypothetical protein AM493_16095 [Flavobacterium akiainvivens]|uniref:Alpha-ketoglutarate decarboxylase n=1 Tax=Flavobacterium akiainvivens TaxID=1202724 RepID=A0A0M8MCJ6_9FLAO|nr:hypothetical protein [Flavobacterium akiainvivens]KOS08383.1 hypothetical protein AM493_16095 [Flavobacterium akiainvivens]